MASIARSFIRALDWSRSREGFRGYPRNSISYGTVGHLDLTPQYARIEDGDVLVEVTLEPTGDEIVARLDFGTVDEGGSYFPLSYGQRVLVAFAGTGNGDPVIIGRLSDGSWPFPDTAAGVPTAVAGSAPLFAFIKTAEGQIIAIESGDGADILIHSGGSVQVKVNPGEQNLITGRTHVGSAASFTTPPTGPTVAPGGFPAPGTPSTPYAPVPNQNVRVTGTLIPPAVVPIPPPPAPPVPQIDSNLRPIPEDGIVRMKDTIQTNATTAPDFFTWLSAVHAGLAGLLPPNTLPGLPASFDSSPVTASLNTASDD
jgi:hypothetical protein